MMMSTNLAAPYPQTCHPGVPHAALRSFQNLARYYESPLHAPTLDAFAAASKWAQSVDRDGRRPLIVDSGCGTGRSTRMLAVANPNAIVIGLDRSMQRLRKGGGGSGCGGGDSATSEIMPSNALLVRAEMASFWRLMLQQDVDISRRVGVNSHLAASRIERHFVLYPNPYPKSSRLNLRWHGHPVLPVLLGLGGSLELRSNWRVYLEEMQQATLLLAEHASADRATSDASDGASDSADSLKAASLCAERIRTRRAPVLEELPPLHDAEDALTLFERKFVREREQLHRLLLPANVPAR